MLDLDSFEGIEAAGEHLEAWGFQGTHWCLTAGVYPRAEIFVSEMDQEQFVGLDLLVTWALPDLMMA